MKNNLRRLNAIMKIFGDVFYDVGIDSYTIKLQGNYKPETIVKAMTYKFNVGACKRTGFILLTRGIYSITLT